ncbi:MAG: hypothetical protein ABH951_00960 [Patescibacteria group bacterium]
MKKPKIFLILMAAMAVLIFLFSCGTTNEVVTTPKPVDTIAGLTLLTMEQIQKYDINLDSLGDIQLRVGPYRNDITLKRKMTDQINEVINGVVVSSKVTKLDSIIIKAMAKGKFVGLRATRDTIWLLVSFEVDSLYLEFKSAINDLKGGFVLNSWNGTSGRPKTFYGKLSYNIRTTLSIPKLYFILDTKQRIVPNVRTIKVGKDINQTQQPVIKQNQTQPIQHQNYQTPIDPNPGDDD